MTNTNDTGFSTSELFAPLRSSTPEISLARLQRAVAAVPAARAIRPMPYVLATVAVLVLSAAGVLLLRPGSRLPLGPAVTKLEGMDDRAMSGARSAQAADGTDGTHATAKRQLMKSVVVEQREGRSDLAPIENHAASANQPTTNAPVISSLPETVAATPEGAVRVDDPVLHEIHSGTNDVRSVHERNAETANDIWRFSAGLQGGVIYGALNTLGGGLALSLDHDWQHLGFRYTSTFGQKTNSDQLFGKLADPTRDYSQRVTEFALLFGLTLRQGEFYATFSGGPNYTKSDIYNVTSTETVVPPQHFDTTGYHWNGIGFTTQASFGVNFASGLGLDLTGFVSFHSQIMYGGTMLTLQYIVTN